MKAGYIFKNNNSFALSSKIYYFYSKLKLILF